MDYTSTADFQFSLFDRAPYFAPVKQRPPAIPLPQHATPLEDISATVALIKSFGKLDPNWDGYGALPIDTRVVNHAISAIDQIATACPLPDVSPNPNGTLSLEWESARGLAHLELGITRYSLFVQPKNAGIIAIDGLADNIQQEVIELIASSLFPPRIISFTMTELDLPSSHVRYPN